MTVTLTAAQARQLGLDVPTTSKRTTRKTAPGPYHTRCHNCGELFTTRAGEDRHLDATHHPRYEVQL